MDVMDFHFELMRILRTQIWVFSNRDVAQELNSDDAIDNAPILLAPRREFSPVGTREYSTAVNRVTSSVYKEITQSCPHVLDDPFESEEDEACVNEVNATLARNVPRSCRDCYIFSATIKFQTRSYISLNSRNLSVFRKAKSNERVPNFDQVIQTCTLGKLMYDKSKSEIITSLGKRSFSESGAEEPLWANSLEMTPQASPPKFQVKKVRHPASSPGIENVLQDLDAEPKQTGKLGFGQEYELDQDWDMPVTKRCKRTSPELQKVYPKYTPPELEADEKENQGILVCKLRKTRASAVLKENQCKGYADELFGITAELVAKSSPGLGAKESQPTHILPPKPEDNTTAQRSDDSEVLIWCDDCEVFAPSHNHNVSF